MRPDVTLVLGGCVLEVREMDRVPVVGEIVYVEDGYSRYVVEIRWKMDGTASVFLAEHPPKFE